MPPANGLDEDVAATIPTLRQMMQRPIQHLNSCNTPHQLILSPNATPERKD